MLSGRRIILGVCGGIAAYKAALLARLLRKEGAEVKVVLTTGAEAFVTPLLFEALVRDRCFTQRDFLAPQGGFIPHTDLAAWAEAIVVAPATASFLSKLARGEPSDLLIAVILASQVPVLLAPAMNTHMFKHPATQENLERLRSFGYHIVPPGEGTLACGEEGPGRMPEPEDLLLEVEKLLTPSLLSGRRVLITGGPTREPLDAVRFISNPSSGRMAVALSRAALILGAEVHLVHGPLSVSPPPGVKTYAVTTAREMLQVAGEIFPEADLVVFAAAVCDLAPAEVLSGKIPKENLPEKISLVPTPDIARELNARKRPHQVSIGFALEEPSQLLLRARKKLLDKGFDLVAANPLSAFEARETEIFLLGKHLSEPLRLFGPKEKVAFGILKEGARVLSGKA